jgi:hypothetical protein
LLEDYLLKLLVKVVAKKGNGSSIADYAYASKKTGEEATPYQKF